MADKAPSNSVFPADYPPQLSQAQSQLLVSAAKEWSISHGLAMFASDQQHPSPDVGDSDDPVGYTRAIPAPITLFPSLFPMGCFNEALIIQTAYNELYANIARDEEWLGSVITQLAEIDDFIAKLWHIHLKVKEEGYIQPLSLGLFRSDYMLHIPSEAPENTESLNTPPTIKQVEFNTIASSFGGLSSRVSSLHRYLLQTAAYPRSAAQVLRPELFPTNASIEKLAAGLASAHRAYGRPITGKLPCVLFIVQGNERNVFDQKHIEYALFAQQKIKVFRVPFDKIQEQTEIVEDQERALIYKPPAFWAEEGRAYEVTTVYLRAGYAPSEYEGRNGDNGKAWRNRHYLERSRAIKCPTILTQLAGCKKVQQILATPSDDKPSGSILDRFLPYPSMSARLRGTFAPMYPLDSATDAGREGQSLALNHETAKNFVMKPQREGGGNNIYGISMTKVLQSLQDQREWAKYILMRLIQTPAPPQRNVIMRDGKLQEGGVVCELGVFGTCLWRQSTGGKDSQTSGDGVQSAGEKRKREEAEGRTPDDDDEMDDDQPAIIENEEAGYLLRTKGTDSEEGGVAAGFGAIDSVCLVDI
ncbi:MAG: hypothetical protein M1831_006057 [Alyxoria varia]|nr:MAG: hypothetical protein M1831_006057 [Alyxoria varia]